MPMSSPVTYAHDLIDILSNHGYVPDETAPEFCRADREFDGTGSVRVIIAENVKVLVFDLYGVGMWSAKFSALTPLAVIEAAIDAAGTSASQAT